MNPRSSASRGDADFVRSLLAAAEVERVPASSRERVARRLGIAATPPSAGAGDPLSEGRAPMTTTRAAAGVWSKVTWLGVVAGLWAGGAASSPPGTGPLPPSPAALPEPPVAASNPAPARSEAAPMTLSSDSKRSRQGAREARRGSGARDEPARKAGRPTTRRLLAEVQQLDQARRLLREGRATDALAALDAYDRRFERGELALEAAVLRVKGSFATGRAAPARPVARRILAAPGSERYRTDLERWLTDPERALAASTGASRAAPDASRSGSIDERRDMGSARN